MEPTAKTKSNASGTVLKALDVLFHLRDASSPLGVTAIARALGMGKSGVHRLLTALATRRLVERVEGGRYELGYGLVSLAAAVSAGDPLVVVAGPVLDDLAGETGETVFLVTERAGVLTVSAKSEGDGFLRAAPAVGESIPVARTAVGKLYAAHAPDRLVRPRPRIPAVVLEETRRCGFARNLEEWQPGLSVLAVPVFVAGEFAGALAVATVAQRMRLLSEKKLARLLQRAAGSIGDALDGIAAKPKKKQTKPN